MVQKSSATFSLKLPPRLTPYVFALYMATIMAFLMCSIITWVQFGWSGHYMDKVLNAYQVAMPAAFFCILMTRPVVMRMVALSVHAGD